MGVRQGTLDRGPLKHRIGTCIWDNMTDNIWAFRAPLILFLECEHNTIIPHHNIVSHKAATRLRSRDLSRCVSVEVSFRFAY